MEENLLSRFIVIIIIIFPFNVCFEVPDRSVGSKRCFHSIKSHKPHIGSHTAGQGVWMQCKVQSNTSLVLWG